MDLNAQNFTKRHPNIQVGKTVCGTGKENFQTVLLARIAGGNPPDASVYWSSPVGLAATGALEPLDDYMAKSATAKKSNWPGTSLSSCQFRGKTWGLPATGSPLAVFYDKDLFSAKGISTKREDFPKTWDDLRKLSKEFTRWKGGQLISAGYVPMYDPTNTNFPATIYVWSALNGGQLYDSVNRKYTINSDQNVAMMEYMLNWLNDEYKGDMGAVKRSANFGDGVDSAGRPPAFNVLSAAMLEDGFWHVSDLYNYPPKFKQYGVASYPIGPGGSKTVSGYWPNWLIVPKGASHPAEGFAWIDYLSSTGMPLWFNITPDLPTNKTVPLMIPAVAKQHLGDAGARDITAFFLHQLAITIPMWNSPVQDFATDKILKAVNQVMFKQAKPKDALASAQSDAQAQLRKVLNS